MNEMLEILANDILYELGEDERIQIDKKSYEKSKSELIEYCLANKYEYYEDLGFGESIFRFKVAEDDNIFFLKVIYTPKENNFEFSVSLSQELIMGDKNLIESYVKETHIGSEYIYQGGYIVTSVKQYIFKSPLNKEIIDYLVSLIIEKNKKAYSDTMRFAIFSLEMDSLLEDKNE